MRQTRPVLRLTFEMQQSKRAIATSKGTEISSEAGALLHSLAST